MNPDQRSFLLSSPSVALIVSQDKTRTEFGSAFLIYRDDEATYWLTCAHVITDVGGAESAKIDGQPVELIAPREEQLSAMKEGCDLAIVKVKCFLEKEPYQLCDASASGKKFTIVGYSQKSKAKMSAPVSGDLGALREINSEGDRTSAWELEITTKDTLQPGYSGSPVIDQETGHVVGVVTQREGEKQGLAIAIGSLKKIAGDLPIQFLTPEDLSDPDSQKKQSLIAASNEIDQLKQALQQFLEEKRAIELKIQDIEVKIQALHVDLEKGEADPGKASLIEKLQKQSELAKKYGDLALNKFSSDLKKVLESHSEDLDYFYLDIETCINRLHLMISYNSISAVDDIPLKLSLSNRSRYGNHQGADAYQELLRLLRQGLTLGASGESKALLLQGLDRIEEQIQLSI
jgi:Trypsin-like peptidase domain